MAVPASSSESASSPPSADTESVVKVAPEHIHKWRTGKHVIKTPSGSIAKETDYSFAVDNISTSDVSIELPATNAGAVQMSTDAGTVGLGLPEPELVSQAKSDGEGSLVYESGNDLSSVVNVDASGAASVNLVIDSPQAGEEFEFPLTLPVGGSARLSDGGSTILANAAGEALGFIATPWARDAAGRDIKTWFELRGSKLVQHVDLSVPGLQYPVVADPWMGQNLLSAVFASSGGAGWPAGGYSIGAYLTNFGRTVDPIVIDQYGWDELVARKPSTRAITSGMRSQWACHATLFGQLIVQDSWDVESWRASNYNGFTWAATRCNW